MISEHQKFMIKERSYDTAFEIWDCIKDEIILYSGMIEDPYFYFHLDLDDVFKSATNANKTIVFEKESRANFKTYLLKDTLLSFELNISFNNIKKSDIKINDVVYYFLADGNYEDDGAIHYVYEGNITLEKIKDFELEFVLELAKETRIAWHKIVNKLDINSNSNRSFLNLEENISKVYVYSEYKNLDLQDTIRLYADDIGLDSLVKKNILTLIQEGYLT